MAEVGVAELRRALKEWLDRVREGDEVIVTERGRAIARLTSVDAVPLLDRLVAEGRMSRPKASDRPDATRQRRLRARGGVSGLVIKARDERR